jgi:hypothetical protein
LVPIKPTTFFGRESASSWSSASWMTPSTALNLRGLAADVAELVAIVLAEVKRLEAAIAAGAAAAPRLREVEREMETLARVTAPMRPAAGKSPNVNSSSASKPVPSRRLLWLPGKLRIIRCKVSTKRSACCGADRIARAITGGAPNALRQWFGDRGISFYSPGSWQAPRVVAPLPKAAKLVALPSN